MASKKYEWLDTQGRGGTVRERFWANVDKRSESECWVWQRPASGRGYGRMHTPVSSSYPAHKVSVLIDGRDVPEGMVVDHICRNRMCVNPLHLRVVDRATNVLENSLAPTALNAKKTECKRGHPFDEQNTYSQPNGRGCRKCQDLHHAASRARRGQVNFASKEIREYLVAKGLIPAQLLEENPDD